jgi:exosortase E/protease (VPEID-CTERM system)
VHVRAPLLALAAGVLAWRTAAEAERLWGILGTSTLHVVAALLRVVRADPLVLPDEGVVGAGGFEVIVAPVCSGVDGLGLVLVFQVLWLSLARSRVRVNRALLLLPAGFVASLGANVLRIAGLVLLGASGHPDLAFGAFHSKLGWILFIMIALTTVLVAEHMRWFRSSEPSATRELDGIPARLPAYVSPLVAALAAALVTSLWASPALDLWYGARVVAAAAALVAFRRDLPRPQLSLSALPIIVGLAVGLAWVALTTGSEATLRVALWDLRHPARIAWVAVKLVGTCLVVPIVEELAFRGFLLPWLVGTDFEAVPPRSWNWLAVGVSSLAFGALHDQWLLGTAAGAAFAAARLARGRLGDAILAHVTANGVIALAVLLGGRWSLWS